MPTWDGAIKTLRRNQEIADEKERQRQARIDAMARKHREYVESRPLPLMAGSGTTLGTMRYKQERVKPASERTRENARVEITRSPSTRRDGIHAVAFSPSARAMNFTDDGDPQG
eukprot:CAMPEP_0169476272 /NCGR_PEP_ID=MMETSP1042-20121227/27278_1 /TAXON_ID=464988 /ORGANISM="Hemiselmis andersenii, Strain CCMP1180" /LENGTH=113 /DNA_ID=CAMNT_0009590511 /DNA_START=168 /DNA_END=505 /DNA_ORIENTATION=-